MPRMKQFALVTLAISDAEESLQVARRHVDPTDGLYDLEVVQRGLKRAVESINKAQQRVGEIEKAEAEQ